MSEISRIKSRNWNISKLEEFVNSISYKKINLKKYEKADLVFSDYLKKAYSEQNKNKLIKISNFSLSQPDDEIKDLCTIGFLSILEEVSLIRKHGSHYRFLNKDTSIGLQKLNIKVIESDGKIFEIFISRLKDIFCDICETGGNPKRSPLIKCLDSKKTGLKKNSIDFIITSPPYLNRNNYIAQQKAELDFLKFINNQDDYRRLVKSTFRSNTDSKLPSSSISTMPEIQVIVNSLQLKESNNQKIPHMICGYFEDMKILLLELFRLLKKGGRCAFVVGNTRWGGVVVPVDHLVMKIAEQIGFKPEQILVTRLKGNSPQQMKKYGKIPVRESIITFSK